MTVCITSNQALWQKAVEITLAKNLDVVCRLGGFHMMMSFLGSIGSLMNGSGLNELLETCYGPNSVDHIMSGKAVSRTLRGHFLVEAALMMRIGDSILPETEPRPINSRSSRIRIEDAQIDIFEEENAFVEDILYVLSESDTIERHDIASNLLELTTIDNLIESNSFRSLSDDILNHRCLLERKSRTTKSWLYEVYEVLKLYIRADRRLEHSFNNSYSENA